MFTLLFFLSSFLFASKSQELMNDIFVQEKYAHTPSGAHIMRKNNRKYWVYTGEEVIFAPCNEILAKAIRENSETIEQCLKNESEFSKDHVAFYHGRARHGVFFDTLNKEVEESKTAEVVLRPARLINDQSMVQAMEHVLEKWQSIAGGNDHDPEYSAQFMAVNNSLFGNMSARGESSWSHFKEMSHFMHYFDYNSENYAHEIIKNAMRAYNFHDRYTKKITRIADEFFYDSQNRLANNSLLQIFIPVNKVGMYAYLARAYGMPLSGTQLHEQQMLFEKLHQEYPKNDQENFVYSDNHLGLCFDQLQARLLITSYLLQTRNDKEDRVSAKVFCYVNKPNNPSLIKMQQDVKRVLDKAKTEKKLGAVAVLCRDMKKYLYNELSI